MVCGVQHQRASNEHQMGKTRKMVPKPKPRVQREMRERIEHLAHLGFSAAEIEYKLAGEPWFGMYLPHPTTIRRIVNRARGKTASGVWLLGDCSPEDAPALMDALRHLTVLSEGRRVSLGRDEADIAVRIHRVAPDLPTAANLWLALLYVQSQADAPDSSHIDAFLAFRPWSSDVAHQAYWDAVDAGHIRFLGIVPPDVYRLGQARVKALIDAQVRADGPVPEDADFEDWLEPDARSQFRFWHLTDAMRLRWFERIRARMDKLELEDGPDWMDKFNGIARAARAADPLKNGGK
jgi:hypothetical protein